MTGNAGGILLTDEFGPTHGNLIAGNIVTDNAYDCGITLPGHNLAVNPQTHAFMPAFGGVYGNVVRNNIVLDNGIQGQGAGIGIFAPAPGTASYDNVIEDNAISGNGLAGVALHGHVAGAYVGGNTISGNYIGPNNLDGDTDVSPTADNATTGILAWSAATADHGHHHRQHHLRQLVRRLARPRRQRARRLGGEHLLDRQHPRPRGVGARFALSPDGWAVHRRPPVRLSDLCRRRALVAAL